MCAGVCEQTDLPNAMEVSEMADKLGLGSMRNRKWYIKGCCATTGDGLYDGLDWMNKTLNEVNFLCTHAVVR